MQRTTSLDCEGPAATKGTYIFRSRDEVFGKTLFDPRSFTHYHLTDAQFALFRQSHKVSSLVNVPRGSGRPVIHSAVKTYFDITTKCNLGCSTCVNSSGSALANELSTDDALRTLEGIAGDATFYVKFSGGEPTQRADWVELLQHAKHLGLTVGINSNGLYTPKTLEALIRLGIDLIDISIDGAKGLHESIRGTGTYDRAVASLQRLSDAGQRVMINSVITNRTSAHDINTLVDLAASYCEDIGFFHLRPFGRARTIMHMAPTFDELAAAWTIIRRAKMEHGFARAKPLLPPDKVINLGKIGFAQGGVDGFSRINIMSDGQVFAGGCVPYVASDARELMSLGDIKAENFSTLRIWHESEKLWRLRDERASFHARCVACSHLNVDCNGFSPEMELYRELHGINPFCKK